MNIKLIGSNCSNGIKMKKMLNKVKDEYDVNISLLDDNESKKKYNIKNIPGLVINDVKICEGKVLTNREIIKYLKVSNA